MEKKYLDYEGLVEVFNIIKQRDSKLESDVTAILNGMAQAIENKADKDDICECMPLTEEEIEEATKPLNLDTLYVKGRFMPKSFGGSEQDWYINTDFDEDTLSVNKLSIAEFVDPQTEEFEFTMKNIDCKGLFYGVFNLIGIDKIDLPLNSTDLSYMFSQCGLQPGGLDNKPFNLSNWNTKYIKSLFGFFFGSLALTEIDLSNWKLTEDVETFGMFYNCSSLTIIYMYNTDETTRNIIQNAIDDASLTNQCKIVY